MTSTPIHRAAHRRPYYGTELYHIAKEAGVLAETVIGKDYFHAATTGTHHLSAEELVEFRRKLLLGYHLRRAFDPQDARRDRTPTVLYNYARLAAASFSTICGAPLSGTVGLSEAERQSHEPVNLLAPQARRRPAGRHWWSILTAPWCAPTR